MNLTTQNLTTQKLTTQHQTSVVVSTGDDANERAALLAASAASTSALPTSSSTLEIPHKPQVIPQRPVALTVNFDGLPDSVRLSLRHQFVLWRYELKGGKYTKVPFNTKGNHASVNAPQTWDTFANVKAAYELNPGRYDGIGVVLTEELGIVAIDMDQQRGPDGEWSADVQAQIESLGTYGEISPGGDGAHFFGIGTLPPAGRKNKDCEMYNDLRFMTLTGHRLVGTPRQIHSCQDGINAFHAKHIVAGRGPRREPKSGAVRPSVRHNFSDDEIIEKALVAKNGSLFEGLFLQDESNPLLRRYGGDHSAMDMGLCVLLAFWSGGDSEQIDRIFRRSQLMRPKWDARHRSDGATYGQLTLEAALRVCDSYYDGGYDPNAEAATEPPTLDFIESLMASALSKAPVKAPVTTPITISANPSKLTSIPEAPEAPTTEVSTSEADFEENETEDETDSTWNATGANAATGEEPEGGAYHSSTDSILEPPPLSPISPFLQPERWEARDVPYLFPPLQLDDNFPPREPDFILTCLEEEEDGDAKILFQLCKNRLLFDPIEKAWFVWKGHYWGRSHAGFERRLVTGQVACQYLNVAAQLMREGNPDQNANLSDRNRKIIDRLMNRAKSLRKLGRVKNVVEMATMHLTYAAAKWDHKPHLLGVQNGVLDLAQARFRAGKPEDIIRTIAPTQWRGIDAPCPRFEQFLLEIFEGDLDTIGLLQRIFGVALWGATVEHMLPIFWGAQGRNGKDTLLEAISFVLGTLAGSVSVGVLMVGQKQHGEGPTPFLYDLQGKRLVWANETNEGAQLNAGQVKYMTGGGEITARPCHGNPVRFKPTHTALLLTNARPSAKSDDSALWSRLLLIPFRMRFVAKPAAPNERLHDLFLLDKLKAEAPGILAWMVRGYFDWKQQGLNPPESVRFSTQNYRESEDSFLTFCEECCDTTDAKARSGAGELYEAYLEFAGQGAMNRNDFAKRLAERFTRTTLHGRKIYTGICLCESAGENPAEA